MDQLINKLAALEKFSAADVPSLPGFAHRA